MHPLGHKAKHHPGWTAGHNAHTGALRGDLVPHKTSKLSLSLQASSMMPEPFKRPARRPRYLRALGDDSRASTGSLFDAPTISSSLSAGTLHPANVSLSRASSMTLSRSGSLMEDQDFSWPRKKEWDASVHQVDVKTPWRIALSVPWESYKQEDALDLYDSHLNPLPSFVCVDALDGLRNDSHAPPHRQKDLFTVYQPRQRVRPSWSPHFTAEHDIDRNPVVDGVRKGLSNRTATFVSSGSPSRRWEDK